MLLDTIALTVHDNLQHAEVIALVQNPRDDIERDGYWERSWIVVWKRPVRNNQPSPDNDGHVYATHRVHVNSKGERACFDGHYDQSKLSAYEDMLNRSGLKTALTDA
jgi:hypothetical protein